jgi:hypothetical protein
MKHTAVDWLSNQAYELFEQYSEGKFDRIKLNKLMVNATNKAKKMEKKQIIDAYQDGYNDHFFTYGDGDGNDDECSIDGPIYKSPTHYYNKLYKNKKLK